MTRGPRMTLQTQLVLRAMLADPAAERYGLQLCEQTGLPSGTIYPIVARLEQLGWVESSWENPAEHVARGRPRRRYYRLTEEGAEQARDALARVYRSRRQPGFGFGVTGPDVSGMAR
jgi:PadR family transcriptional regulator, regulatory protein PadR